MPEGSDLPPPSAFPWRSFLRGASGHKDAKKEAGKGSRKGGLRDLRGLRKAWAVVLLVVFCLTFIFTWVVFYNAADAVDPWTLRVLLLHSVTMFVTVATYLFR